MNTDIARRLADLDVRLPAPTTRGGIVVPATTNGALAFFSGKIATGRVGRLGAEISLEDGVVAAHEAAIGLLGAIEAEVGLEHVAQVLKLTVFIASADGFTAQPDVANGASRLLVDVLGNRGRHARSAIGVAWLPEGTPVEIEAILAISPEATAQSTASPR